MSTSGDTPDKALKIDEGNESSEEQKLTNTEKAIDEKQGVVPDAASADEKKELVNENSISENSEVIEKDKPIAEGIEASADIEKIGECVVPDPTLAEEKKDVVNENSISESGEVVEKDEPIAEQIEAPVDIEKIGDTSKLDEEKKSPTESPVVAVGQVVDSVVAVENDLDPMEGKDITENVDTSGDQSSMETENSANEKPTEAPITVATSKSSEGVDVSPESSSADSGSRPSTRVVARAVNEPTTDAEADLTRIELPYPRCDTRRVAVTEFPTKLLDCFLQFDDENDIVRLNVTQLNMFLTKHVATKKSSSNHSVYAADWKTQKLLGKVECHNLTLPKDWEKMQNIPIADFSIAGLKAEEKRMRTLNEERKKECEKKRLSILGESRERKVALYENVDLEQPLDEADTKKYEKASKEASRLRDIQKKRKLDFKETQSLKNYTMTIKKLKGKKRNIRRYAKQVQKRKEAEATKASTKPLQKVTDPLFAQIAADGNGEDETEDVTSETSAVAQKKTELLQKAASGTKSERQLANIQIAQTEIIQRIGNEATPKTETVAADNKKTAEFKVPALPAKAVASKPAANQQSSSQATAQSVVKDAKAPETKSVPAKANQKTKKGTFPSKRAANDKVGQPPAKKSNVPNSIKMARKVAGMRRREGPRRRSRSPPFKRRGDRNKEYRVDPFSGPVHLSSSAFGNFADVLGRAPMQMMEMQHHVPVPQPVSHPAMHQSPNISRMEMAHLERTRMANQMAAQQYAAQHQAFDMNYPGKDMGRMQEYGNYGNGAWASKPAGFDIGMSRDFRDSWGSSERQQVQNIPSYYDEEMMREKARLEQLRQQLNEIESRERLVGSRDFDNRRGRDGYERNYDDRRANKGAFGDSAVTNRQGDVEGGGIGYAGQQWGGSSSFGSKNISGDRNGSYAEFSERYEEKTTAKERRRSEEAGKNTPSAYKVGTVNSDRWQGYGYNR